MRISYISLFSLFLISPAVRANYTYNLTPGVTPISHDLYNLHMTIFWICVAIGILVFGFILHSILYHRKTNGKKPAEFHEHLWLELAWTIIPLLILVAMAIPATRVLMNMNDDNHADLTIKVTGYQWKWRYEYLDQNINFFSNITTSQEQIHNAKPKTPDYLRTVDHPLVLPIHKKIRFLFTANDVIHSWWVPDLGIKRDAIPGFINESWARINRPGIYYGQCTELCGINHAYMIIVVLAVTETEFADWIAVQKGEKPAVPAAVPTPTSSITSVQATPATIIHPPTTTVPPTPGKPLTLPELMQQGEKVFLNNCAVCHKPDGAGSPPTFPALKGSAIATGPLPVHLNRVMNGKPGTAMQAFKEQLNDADLAAVITYERNAWGNNKGDLVQAADITAARAGTTKPSGGKH